MFFYQVITALIIFQLAMLALLGLKQSVVPAILVIPLLPLTLLFMYFCAGVFTRPFQVLSLRAAVDLDEYRTVRLHLRCRIGWGRVGLLSLRLPLACLDLLARPLAPPHRLLVLASLPGERSVTCRSQTCQPGMRAPMRTWRI